MAEEKNSSKKKTVKVSKPVTNKKKTSKKKAPATQESSKTKAAIVGTASTTAHLAPDPDKNPEFFICGLAWRKSAPKADRVYEMHRLQTGHVSTPPNYIKFLNETIKRGTEVYAYDHIPGVEGVKVFPLKEIVSWLAKKTHTTEKESTYFMSTLCYELAHLMYEGWKEIHIYGVDLSTQREYAHQKPNFEYLIGLARGMGIKVYFPEGSSLCKGTHLYGYERPPGEGAITVGDLKKKKKAYEQEHQEAMARFYTLDGARQELDAQIKFLEQLQKGINPGNYSDPIKKE